jgi:hypothetical protein
MIGDVVILNFLYPKLTKLKNLDYDKLFILIATAIVFWSLLTYLLL